MYIINVLNNIYRKIDVETSCYAEHWLHFVDDLLIKLYVCISSGLLWFCIACDLRARD